MYGTEHHLMELLFRCPGGKTLTQQKIQRIREFFLQFIVEVRKGGATRMRVQMQRLQRQHHAIKVERDDFKDQI